MQNIVKLSTINLTKIIETFIFVIALLFAPANSMASQINGNLPSANLVAAANQSETTYPTDDKNVGNLLYSDSNKVESLNSVDDFVSPQRQKELLNPAQIPAKKQPILDRSDPDAKLLEKTKKMFEEAGNFSAN